MDAGTGERCLALDETGKELQGKFEIREVQESASRKGGGGSEKRVGTHVKLTSA